MNISDLTAKMSLEEKAAFVSGEDMWHLKGIQRLGIPSVMVTDGPHGLRKQAEGGDHLGLGSSVPATAFPTAAALASSFDRSVAQKVGAAIGEECQAENVAVILGPGANIKRSPLCGRNFEYFSEDPFLSGEMAAAHIIGVQSKGVGTSLKHFALNNQETCRMSCNSVADERTMREIYLATFEIAVKKGRPWTVMCSYNRVNGTFACENEFLLTDILRNDWGFDGYVMTDWGAMDDQVLAVKAGLELQMPGPSSMGRDKLINAVQSGELDAKVLDRAVERILSITLRAYEKHVENAVYSIEEHDNIARTAETECAVLLKNDHVLPIAKNARVLVVGEFARHPRYQGGGSSHINPNRLTTVLDAIGEYTTNWKYEQGYRLDGKEDETLLQTALKAAYEAEYVICMAGLPDSIESEGFDRKDLHMPENQIRLIRALKTVNTKVVVVLSNGAPVEMPWLSDAPALLEMYLGGQASGGAACDLLFGKVNPSGRLAETFPIKLEHNPSYLNYANDRQVEYKEGVFVGYRYYEKKKLDVLFPFGFGLSYTDFSCSNLRVDKNDLKDNETVIVTVDVQNVGSCAGKEVVQLYISAPKGSVERPVRELKGFEKVYLLPGETKTIEFSLSKRAFAYWDIELHDWYVEDGVYGIEIGRSSNDIVLKQSVTIHPVTVKKLYYDIHSTMADLLKHPVGKQIVANMMQGFLSGLGVNTGDSPVLGMNDEAMMGMMGSMPLNAMISFSNGAFSLERANEIIKMLNAE